MSWSLSFIEEADKDYQNLNGSQCILVDKALEKVKQNPLPQRGGGYGKELANKSGANLAGLLKFKLKASGIRIVYKGLDRVNKWLRLKFAAMNLKKMALRMA